MLSHYLNQCWLIANWTPGNKFHWNLNKNSFHSRKCVSKCRLNNDSYFVLVPMCLCKSHANRMSRLTSNHERTDLSMHCIVIHIYRVASCFDSSGYKTWLGDSLHMHVLFTLSEVWPLKMLLKYITDINPDFIKGSTTYSKVESNHAHQWLRFVYGRRWFNSLRPRQNGRQFPDDIFKCIFMSENVIISIKISLKFVPMGSIDNIPTLVPIMAWRRPGGQPLSEPMMVRPNNYSSNMLIAIA